MSSTRRVVGVVDLVPERDLDPGHRGDSTGAEAPSPGLPAVHRCSPRWPERSGEGSDGTAPGYRDRGDEHRPPLRRADTVRAGSSYAHAISVAGDACLTVSLAGSLFFQSPTSAAREKVLLYLLLTMAPFAIVAPILGPMLDRTRGGRRLLVVASAAGRAVICLFMAMYVTDPAPEGLLVYPLAFGALVLAKGHSIAKSSLVPALVKSDDELVNANSRLALLSVIAATIGGMPAAGIQQLFGADWSLRRRRGGVRGGRGARAEDPADPGARRRGPASCRTLEEAEIHQPSILLAGSAMAVLRGAVGFLAFFVAFALKDDLFGLGVALAASAVGGFLGVVAAPVLRRSVREETILAGSLVVPAVFALLGTLLGDAIGFVVAAFALAVGAAAGRLGFDSVLQRDGPDAVRGRAFARFETRLPDGVGGRRRARPPARRRADRPARARDRARRRRVLVRRRAAGGEQAGPAHPAAARLGRPRHRAVAPPGDGQVPPALPEGRAPGDEPPHRAAAGAARLRPPGGSTGGQARYWPQPLVAPCTMPNGPTGQRKQSTISMSTCSRVAMPSSTAALASRIMAP